MEKIKSNIFLFIAGAIVAVLALVSVANIMLDQETRQQPSQAVSKETSSDTAETISYPGQSGKDAMTLLESVATVEKSQSGFVTAINNRKVDEAKKEFWAFYVNGEMAQVGASEYMTNDADIIEWKIEQY